ncbi:DUF2690 domain-containing protein [Streptomyces sp. NPDC006645]|uniref:helix-turn-helix domain-containing protein n=1 Tax=unclassified Streptomyces TaxID=2593676 RepID=UPI0033A21280
MTMEHSGHIRLSAALRALRARTGLSLAALSQRTAYSKSTWERYLNGKSLPPRQAVQELCRLANEPDGRLLALWEIAESHWSGRAAVPAPTADEPPPLPPPPPEPPGPGRPKARRGGLIVLLASACVVIVGGAALLLVLLPDRYVPKTEGLSAAAPYSLAPQCHGAACESLDPIRLFCGYDPDTLSTRLTTTGAHLELRYSEKCGASWAMVWGTRIGDRVQVKSAGPAYDARVEDTTDTETYVYTEMTATHPGSTVRACFRPASKDGERECVQSRVPATTPTARPRSPR